MIQRAIDRRRPTRGGLTLSVAIHAGLLLLLMTYLGQQARQVAEQDELTEIAYIEAHYGEDVAKKVRMKALPKRLPGPRDPGKGISTESAVKSKPSPPPARKAEKPQMAEASAPSIEPQAPPKMLEAQPRMQSRERASAKTIIDTGQLRRAGVDVVATTDAAPNLKSRKKAPRFQPEGTALRSRSGSAAIAEVSEVGSRRGRPSAGAVADVSPELSGGGALQSSGKRYSAPVAGLESTGTRGGGTSAITEVDGPGGTGSGGSESGRRRTILDYGTGGGGGGGGSLRGRAKLAEAPDTKSIVKDDEPARSTPADVADAALGGKGVSMTITGQISDRKILSSASPVYTDRARRNGWEGAVAVHFTVLPDGRVKDNMYFDQTSMHRDLNQAAMDAIRKFRFAALPSGRSEEQWGVITIIFRLN